MSGNSNNGGGPCGACKFLRRKCLNGCVFAPYFDSEQGTAHFAAVHRVFGASNASKLLLRIPSHKRLDAVVSICYEALARVRDPVYGCVGHIFALQQQVVNLQAELAYVRANISIMQRLPPPPPPPVHAQTPASVVNLDASSDALASLSNVSVQFDPPQPQDTVSWWNSIDDELEDGEVLALAKEFVARYLPGVRFRPPSPH